MLAQVAACSKVVLSCAVLRTTAGLVCTTKRKSGTFKWTVLEKYPWMRFPANTIYEDLRGKGILKENWNWSELENDFSSFADFSKHVLLHLSSNAKNNQKGKKSAGEKSA